MTGILDLLGITSPAMQTQDGQVTGPVGGWGGLLDTIGQKLSNNSDQLTGFGMGMLSGATPQEGWGNAAAGLRAGQKSAQQSALLQQAQADKINAQLARKGLAAKYGLDPSVANLPDVADAQIGSRMTPDKGQIIGSKDSGYFRVFQNGTKQPIIDPVEDKQTLNEKLYNQLSPEEQAAARKSQFGIAGDTSLATRAANAAAVGLKPEDPAYKSFLLTGKMPREDAQPLTATDKKAIQEADDAVYSANVAIDNLKKAKELSKQAYEGPLAGTRGYVGSLVGNKAGEATQNLDNLVQTNALSQLKSIFGGNPTEGERAILLEIQGSSSKPDAVRQEIYDRAIAMAQRRMQFNAQRSNELRGGSYYKTGGGQQQPGQAAQPTAGKTSSGIPWSVE